MGQIATSKPSPLRKANEASQAKVTVPLSALPLIGSIKVTVRASGMGVGMGVGTTRVATVVAAAVVGVGTAVEVAVAGGGNGVAVAKRVAVGLREAVAEGVITKGVDVGGRGVAVSGTTISTGVLVFGDFVDVAVGEGDIGSGVTIPVTVGMSVAVTVGSVAVAVVISETPAAGELSGLRSGFVAVPLRNPPTPAPLGQNKISRMMAVAVAPIAKFRLQLD